MRTALTRRAPFARRNLSAGQLAGLALSVVAAALPGAAAYGQGTVDMRWTGEISETDAISPGRGSRADVYVFSVPASEAGLTIQIDLVSAFDNYLAVHMPGNQSRVDDDGGEGTNARVVIEDAAEGSYRISAEPLSPDGLGEYVLTAVSVYRPDSPPIEGALHEDDEAMASGERVDRIRIGPLIGYTRYRVTLVSLDFDAYLIIRLPNGQQIDNDDADDSTLDARLTFDVDRSIAGQIVEVMITSAAVGELGEYQLAFQTVTSEKNRRWEGVLGAAALTVPGGGRRYVPHSMELAAGDRVTVTLRASWDTYLLVSFPGAEGYELANDDDGSSLNSRIGFVAPTSGTYEYWASAYGQGIPTEDGGQYVLQAAVREPLGFGETEGAIDEFDPTDTEGRSLDSLSMVVAAGTRVRVRMESDEIDPYLRVTSETGAVLENDDGAGDSTSAEIEFTVQRTGQILIVCTTFQPGKRGAYRLIITPMSASD